jgi:WD40 repeat protein/tRNA A-37 threonylcarbamoyl transferase component Bud32
MGMPDPGNGDREERLGAAVFACLQALEAGERLGEPELRARYPDLADELLEYLAGRQDFERLAAPLRAVAQSSPTPLPSLTFLVRSAPESGAALQAGSFGDYDLLEEIGQGGMGVVYKARQKSLNRLVALKMIRTGVWASETEVRRFRQEAETAAALDHPHIVPVYEVGEWEGHVYLVFKLIEGGSLAGRLAEFGTDPRAAGRMVAEVARAVHHAHQRGVLHRDLKPSNILLDRQGEPHVTDFGLAKRLEEDGSLTESGALVGTPSYMAPEQAAGLKQAVTTATDVYGLGALLYVLLTGRPPFRAESAVDTLLLVREREPEPPRRINAKVDPDLETICLKCLQKEPGRRYGSAELVAEDLERWLAGEPIQARPVGRAARLWRWCRRNSSLATLAALLVLLLAGLAVTALVGYTQTSSALKQVRSEHQQTVSHLYGSLVREARAVRLARMAGYREQAWRRLRQACALDTPERDLAELRQEAVACMGDFVGLDPAVIAGFPAEIRLVACRPRVAQMAVGLSDGTLLLCGLPTGQEFARWHGHDSAVGAAAFDPGGNLLVSSDSRGTIKVWRVGGAKTRECIRTLMVPPPAHPQSLPVIRLENAQAAITPDLKYLLACPLDSCVLPVWDLEHGRRAGELRSEVGTLTCMAVSPDGCSVAAGAYDTAKGSNTLLVWDLGTRKLRYRFPDRPDYVYRVAFSPDSRLVATCEGGIAVLELPSGRERVALRGDSALAASFGPDGHLLAFHTLGAVVTLWSIPAKRAVAELRSPTDPRQRDGIIATTFSADGRFLISATRNAVAVWSLQGTPERAVLAGHGGGVPGLSFSRDGRRLASAGRDHTVTIWDTATGQAERVLGGLEGPVQAVAFSPDGSMLAAAESAGSVCLWEVATWQEWARPDHRLGPGIWSIAFSPDSKYLAGSAENGRVEVWEIQPAAKPAAAPSLRRVVALDRGERIWNVCFSRDSRLLTFVANSQALHLYDLDSRRLLPGLPARHVSDVLSTAFHPDGRHVLFVTPEGVAEAWDLTTRQKDFALGGPGEFIGTGIVALSPDGNWLAASPSPSTIAIWDTRNRKRLLTLPAERMMVWSFAWSPDGRQLAVGLADGGLSVWNLPEMRAQLATLGLDWEGD